MITALRYLFAASAVAALVGCSSTGGSGNMQRSSQTQASLPTKAASLLQRQRSQPPKKRIPKELVADAKCIAVFPSVVQAGIIIGGHHGKGLVSCRQQSNGWGQAVPAVYSLSGGSIGVQAGVQKSSVVLLFLTRDSMNSLLKSHLKLGSQLGVTTGPIGFNAHVGGAPAPVVAYVTSKKGLFAGVNLNGTELSYNKKANTSLYGQGATDPSSILLGSNTNQVPASMDNYVQALQSFAPNSSSQQPGSMGQGTGSMQQGTGSTQQGSGSMQQGSQGSGSY